MAVASPVLERKVNTEEIEYTRENRDSFLNADERHNSRISENYARLINPESKPKDIIPVQHVAEKNFEETAVAPVETPAPVREVVAQKPYLVENARADAAIFRADSAVNRKIFGTTEIAPVNAQTEEEENEDLRPTQTTIQYKTVAATKSVEEGRIETRPAKVRHSALTKKDKITIAVALTVIIALFVLIIVNSAVISNLSNEVSVLQNTLNIAQTTNTEALAEKTEFFENIEQIVSDFAIDNGMFR